MTAVASVLGCVARLPALQTRPLRRWFVQRRLCRGTVGLGEIREMVGGVLSDGEIAISKEGERVQRTPVANCADGGDRRHADAGRCIVVGYAQVRSQDA